MVHRRHQLIAVLGEPRFVCLFLCPVLPDFQNAKNPDNVSTPGPRPSTIPLGGFMSKSRRQFLRDTSHFLLGSAIAFRGNTQQPDEVPPGMPSAFGVGPAFGPAVSTSSFAEAEKLMQVQMTDAQRAMAAATWRTTMAPIYERRTGPRKVTLESSLAPASRWDPVLTSMKAGPERDRFVRTQTDPGPLPGTPWGGQELLDPAGIATTYGAETYRNRVPAEDAAVVKRLHDAGAVLVAKLSLGALALKDIWFGGQTMNPWLPEEGSGGSSAGPAAAVAAGLVGFAIGSETGGSIVDPSMRCGISGLRPTYGRVPRTGAMTLCWSLDKLGPMTRRVEDTMLVLHAISGPDPGDVASVPSRLDFDANASASGLRVGYFPAWMKESPATDVDRSALSAVSKVGMVPVEVSLPDWPYDSLDIILFAEAAAAFE